MTQTNGKPGDVEVTYDYEALGKTIIKTLQKAPANVSQELRALWIAQAVEACVQNSSGIEVKISDDPETGLPRWIEKDWTGQRVLWVGGMGQEILSNEYADLLQEVANAN